VLFGLGREMTERTRQFDVGAIVRVSSAAPVDYKGRTGIVTEIGPGDAEYRIEFEDGALPTTGYLAAAWLTLQPSGAAAAL
jgi:hypothetical protein